MILSIISLILNGLGLYLHLTAVNRLALAILIVYIVLLYGLGAISGIIILIKSIFKQKVIPLIFSLISIGISTYGLITIFK